MKTRAALIATALLIISPAAALRSQEAITSQPTESGLDATTRGLIVANFAKAMRDRYIVPETGDAVATRLERASATGEFDDIVNVSALARKLTADAAAIAHDKHLKVMAPRRGSALRRGPTLVSARDGISKVDRLRGKIGYIEIVTFPPAAEFKRTLDPVLRSLRGSRALIIDLRRNGGGEPDAVAYLISFFVEQGRHLDDIVTRIPGTKDFTREKVLAARTPTSFRNVRLYVLTSADTFSGGEALAYDLRILKRAAIIGEQTGGGANMVDTFDLGYGVIAVIPYQRVESAVTRTNWERTGICPDTPVPAAAALSVALEQIGLTPQGGRNRHGAHRRCDGGK